MGTGNAPTNPFIPLPGNREITHRQQIGKLGPSGEKGSVCTLEQRLWDSLYSRPHQTLIAQTAVHPPSTIRAVPVT